MEDLAKGSGFFRHFAKSRQMPFARKGGFL
jgi:hypothetical protein